MSADGREESGNGRCDQCGRPAAITIGEDRFCEECYQLAGSCCMEFGGEDLWEADEKEASSSAPSAESEERRKNAA